ncbi:MAG: hypothetical protein EBR82_55320 [Caulobacteraceae bacterium]|nr:hypothetical protein [Caulobacteraceae bacterium]
MPLPYKISSFNDADWMNQEELDKFLRGESVDYGKLPRGITNIPLLDGVDENDYSPTVRFAQSINSNTDSANRMSEFNKTNPHFFNQEPQPIASKLDQNTATQDLKRDLASYLFKKYGKDQPQITSSSDIYNPSKFEEAIKQEPELLHTFHPEIENKQINYVASPTSPSAKEQSQPAGSKPASQSGLPLSKIKTTTETTTPKGGGQNGFLPDWDKLEEMLTQDMSKGEHQNATSRLIGNINMAVNQAIAGMTNTKPDYTIPNSIIEGGKQKLDQAGKRGDKLRDYLKLKLENKKLGLEKEKLEKTYEVAKQRNNLLSQRKNAQVSPWDKTTQQEIAKSSINFAKTGGMTKVASFIAKTKELANELRTKVIEQPGLLSMMVKNTGNIGGAIFDSRHSELAKISARAKALYLANMKEYVGNNQISDNDVRTYLSTLYDWAIDPKESADLLEQKASQILDQARFHKRANDHWLRYRTFDNFNFNSSPMGTFTEEME